MAFWFKAWNKIKPGSYTVAQISTTFSAQYLFQIDWPYVPPVDNYTTPIYAMDIAQMLFFGWLSMFRILPIVWFFLTMINTT